MREGGRVRSAQYEVMNVFTLKILQRDIVVSGTVRLLFMLHSS